MSVSTIAQIDGELCATLPVPTHYARVVQLDAEHIILYHRDFIGCA